MHRIPNVRLKSQLELLKCPHCKVAKPMLSQNHRFQTTDHSGANPRFWAVYVCSSCGGLVLASSPRGTGLVSEIYPRPVTVDQNIPDPARSYLLQALDSLHSPAGCVMLCASAVDAMLKAKEYKEDSLHDRINKAAEDNLITAEMAAWAHEVRLDANEPRLAD